MADVSDIELDKGRRIIPGLKNYEINAWSLSATICKTLRCCLRELWDDFCSMSKNPDAGSSFRSRAMKLFRTVPISHQPRRLNRGRVRHDIRA